LTGVDGGPISVDELGPLLDSIPIIAGSPRRVCALTGGLTNHNFRVTTESVDCVVRVFSTDAGLLAIDRDAEYVNSVSAAQAGVGAPVLDYRPQDGVLIVAYLPGRTLGAQDLADPKVLLRLAQACRTLHSGARFAGEFDMFSIQRRYLDIVGDNGFALPRGYREFAPQLHDLRMALAARPEPIVACHNDLLAANMIDDGTSIRLIDYEYAGNNDPCFELGNLACESSLSRDQLDCLLAAYFAGTSVRRLARARLFGMLAEYTWTLWAVIQHATSGIEFDYADWGRQKYERAAAGFAGAEFATLLDAAAGA
jgi:thiamine kinase-like enzyme